MNIFTDGKVLANLNKFASEWKNEMRGEPSKIHLLQKILERERIDLPSMALSTLELVHRICAKMTLKQIHALLHENTLLQQETIEILLTEDFPIKAIPFATNQISLHWSICAVKTDQFGKAQNKMYVKTEIMDKGISQRTTFTLHEFKEMMREMKKTVELMNQ